MPEVDVSQVGSPPMPEVAKPLPAPPINNDSEAVVSPTGAPVLPPAAVPYLAALVAAAGVVREVATDSRVQMVAGVILAVGTVLGLASPGLRRKQ